MSAGGHTQQTPARMVPAKGFGCRQAGSPSLVCFANGTGFRAVLFDFAMGFARVSNDNYNCPPDARRHDRATNTRTPFMNIHGLCQGSNQLTGARLHRRVPTTQRGDERPWQGALRTCCGRSVGARAVRNNAWRVILGKPAGQSSIRLAGAFQVRLWFS